MGKRTVRIRNSFSDKNNIKPINKEILLIEFPKDTRKVLFNSLKVIIQYAQFNRRIDPDNIAQFFIEDIFNDIFRSERLYSVMSDVETTILQDPYYDVLSLTEKVCQAFYETYNEYQNRIGYSTDYFSTFDYMNEIFENEFIGYRFINEVLIQISNKDEQVSVENASSSSYSKINEHIIKASALLSETGVKDYKNSIKESITGLETLVNLCLEANGETLGKGIEKYFQNVEIHKDLKDSIKSLYKYASDEEGVRHGNNKESKNVNFDEAKFVLVTCSAIINYILGLESQK